MAFFRYLLLALFFYCFKICIFQFGYYHMRIRLNILLYISILVIAFLAGSIFSLYKVNKSISQQNLELDTLNHLLSQENKTLRTQSHNFVASGNYTEKKRIMHICNQAYYIQETYSQNIAVIQALVTHSSDNNLSMKLGPLFIELENQTNDSYAEFHSAYNFLIKDLYQ